MSFLGHILLSLVLFVVPLIIYFGAKSGDITIFHGAIVNLMVIILSIYYLITLTFIFSAWVTFYYDLYILTTDEIIDITQQGIWGRKIARLSLLRVQDTSSSIHGFLPTLFAYGNVLIETAGDTENFLLESVPNPQAFSAKVLELHSSLINKGGFAEQISQGEGDITGPIKDTDVPALMPKPNFKSTPEINTNIKPKLPEDDGEVSKDDLKKGGEIRF